MAQQLLVDGSEPSQPVIDLIMRSLIAALFLTLAITVSLHAAPTFHFETKDWRGEQIQLPPGLRADFGLERH